MSEHDNTWLQDLTQAQQHKYYTLKAIYGEEQAAKIAKVLNERGRNSYSAFIDKMNLWTGDMSEDDRQLYDELYPKFPLGVDVTTNDIIEKVTKARVKLQLGFYRSKVKQRCETVFFNMFAIKDVEKQVLTDDGKTTQHVGYTPLASTKPPQID